jgi:serine/threonine-protein kinase
VGATDRTLACPECGSSYVQGVKFCAQCGIPLSSVEPALLDLGALVGNYRLLEVLGEGGMGRVYVAEHVKLGRRVAVKKLHSELASNPTAVARFFAEARAVNRISHDHIVEITDFLEQPGGDNYIVMELLKGEDLAHRLSRKRVMPLPRAFDIAAQTAGALSAVHAAGMIHRDLKPDNIFLIDRGGSPDFVKVLDFGVAKLTDGERGVPTHVTAAGQIIGTPEYMSPEQAGGMTVDHRTDIYALGVILYEMVTGELPFQAKSFGELLIQHMTSPVELPSFVPGLPQVIQTGRDQLLLQLLAKKPSDRPRSMAEVETRLRGLIDAMEPPPPKKRPTDNVPTLHERGEPMPPRPGAGTGPGAGTPASGNAGAVAKLALIKRATPQAAIELPTPRSVSRIEVPTPTSLSRYSPDWRSKAAADAQSFAGGDTDIETQSAKIRRIARLQVSGSSPGIGPTRSGSIPMARGAAPIEAAPPAAEPTAAPASEPPGAPARRAITSPPLDPRQATPIGEPAAPGPPRRSRPMLWLGALAVVIAAGFVVYEARPEGGSPAAPPAARVTEPAEIRIKFVSAPPGATVRRVDTGKTLGVTPFTQAFPRSDQTARFEFALPGFAPVAQDLALSADDALAAALTAIPEPPAAPSSPAPAAAAAPEPARKPAAVRHPAPPTERPVDRNGTLDVFKHNK